MWLNNERVMMKDHLFCKIFVESVLTGKDLTHVISNIVNGTIELEHYITSAEMEIDVLENDEYDEILSKDSNKGFLYYRYYLEIETTDDVAKSNYIFKISNLLENLWHQGNKAVAACDFEEELPKLKE